MNIIETLTATEPFTGTVRHLENALTQRAAIIEASRGIKVTSQDGLEMAVKALQEIAGMLKVNEASRVKEKKPHLDYGKAVDKFAADFAEPLEKEKARLSGEVNHWQRKQLEEQQKREREAAEEQRKAQQAAAKAEEDARKAQEAIDKAKTDVGKKKAADALLEAQLAQEEAAMTQQAVETQLVQPTNTPRGLSTRVRYDFEITNWITLVAKKPDLWVWHPGTETLKFDRAGFLKALNSETIPHPLLPKETQQSVVHSVLGLRIYSDVRTHVRA
jgi:hypothetical protein